MRSPQDAVRRWVDGSGTLEMVSYRARVTYAFNKELGDGKWGIYLDPETSIAILKERYVDGVYTIEQFEEYVGQVLARAAV